MESIVGGATFFFFLNLSKLGTRVHRSRGLAHIQEFPVGPGIEYPDLCQFFSPATRRSLRSQIYDTSRR